MNRNSKNCIDVVIPVHDGEKFILDALNSAENQTLPPEKIIVVDDGSVDKTYGLVSEYAKSAKVKIEIIKKANGGLSSARNAGIRASKAEFIAFLDADDTWTINKLEKQIKIFKNTAFSNLALVYCNYDVIDTIGVKLYENYKVPLDPKRMRGKVFKKLLERNQIASSGSGALVKRSVFDSVGLFDENLKFGEDWDMWLRIAEKFEVDFAPEILAHIRKHAGNMTASSIKTFGNELEFYKKWLGKIEGKHPAPLFWSDKITFRILFGRSHKEALKLVKNKLTEKFYKILFRKTLGNFWLYVPFFFLRQILNLAIYPKYLPIIWKYVRYGGK